MSQLTIDKEEYTSRNELLKGRDVYILTLEGVVDDNSYLFSSAFPIEIPDYKSFREKVTALKVSKRVDIKKIESLVNEFSTIKKKGELRTHSKINDKYVIPGSSLKGAIRSRIEYKFIPVNNKIKSCYIVEDDFFLQQAVNHRKFWGDDVIRKRGSCNVQSDDKACIVCDMFGSQYLASLVSISDTYLLSGNSEKLSDLYNIDAIKPQSRFSTTIVCRNFDYTRLGLLFLGLELYSKSPILLGMYKYRFNPKVGKVLFRDKYAFGLVRFNLTDVTSLINNNKLDVKELIEQTKNVLRDKFKEYIDWKKGVIENERTGSI
ncbi:MAG: RAMP superfamily CRISPR-associated protein [Candidatus Nitrosocaldus sp.]